MWVSSSKYFMDEKWRKINYKTDHFERETKRKIRTHLEDDKEVEINKILNEVVDDDVKNNMMEKNNECEVNMRRKLIRIK